MTTKSTWKSVIESACVRMAARVGSSQSIPSTAMSISEISLKRSVWTRDPHW